MLDFLTIFGTTCAVGSIQHYGSYGCSDSPYGGVTGKARARGQACFAEAGFAFPDNDDEQD